MTVKVSSKYQVVIPEGVREILGIRPGMKVDVIAKGHVAYLVPVVPVSDLQKELKGKVGAHDLREKGHRKV